MSKRELIEKIEEAFEMVIAVSVRKYKIIRDEEDRLIVADSLHQEPVKHYSRTNDLISRFKVDGHPLRNLLEAVSIVEYTALLDA